MIRSLRFRLPRGFAAALVVLGLAGCAHYQPRPLPESPDLAAQLPTVDWDRVAAPVPGLGHIRFDPADGLNRDETVILAITHNPDLVAARARLGLAQAQLFAADLLPDPQLDVGLEKATGGTTNPVLGYSLGLTEDLRALIQRSSAQKAADNHRQQVNLELLWQEWQVAERTRERFIDIRGGERRLSRLKALQRLNRQRYEADQQGLEDGMVDQTTVDADRSALADSEDRLAQLKLTLSRLRAELNQLLGLAPDVAVQLAGGESVALPDDTAIDRAVADIGQRRPDLIALRYGYANQEEQVSLAILSQFPGISVGLTAARDTGNARTLGLDLSLKLPLFDGQRGAIAIQRAKRTVLRSDYQQRLDQATSDSRKIASVARKQQSRLTSLQQQAQRLKAEAESAQNAVAQGLLDQRSADNLKAQWLEWQLRQIRAETDLAQSGTMLATVLGLPLKAKVP